MTKEFNSLDEIQEYYDEESDTYIFKENGDFIDLVVFNFNLNVGSNINANDINAKDIEAEDITARDINVFSIGANNINARDIKAVSDIEANNINARDIKTLLNIEANDINARDIKALNIEADSNINARNIDYFAICCAYQNIKCNSIKGRRENAKHFVLDGKLEVENG